MIPSLENENLDFYSPSSTKAEVEKAPFKDLYEESEIPIEQLIVFAIENQRRVFIDELEGLRSQNPEVSISDEIFLLRMESLGIARDEIFVDGAIVTPDLDDHEPCLRLIALLGIYDQVVAFSAHPIKQINKLFINNKNNPQNLGKPKDLIQLIDFFGERLETDKDLQEVVIVVNQYFRILEHEASESVSQDH